MRSEQSSAAISGRAPASSGTSVADQRSAVPDWAEQAWSSQGPERDDFAPADTGSASVAAGGAQAQQIDSAADQTRLVGWDMGSPASGDVEGKARDVKTPSPQGLFEPPPKQGGFSAHGPNEFARVPGINSSVSDAQKTGDSPGDHNLPVANASQTTIGAYLPPSAVGAIHGPLPEMANLPYPIAGRGYFAPRGGLMPGQGVTFSPEVPAAPFAVATRATVTGGSGAPADSGIPGLGARNAPAPMGSLPLPAGPGSTALSPQPTPGNATVWPGTANSYPRGTSSETSAGLQVGPRFAGQMQGSVPQTNADLSPSQSAGTAAVLNPWMVGVSGRVFSPANVTPEQESATRATLGLPTSFSAETAAAGQPFGAPGGSARSEPLARQSRPTAGGYGNAPPISSSPNLPSPGSLSPPIAGLSSGMVGIGTSQGSVDPIAGGYPAASTGGVNIYPVAGQGALQMPPLNMSPGYPGSAAGTISPSPSVWQNPAPVYPR